MIRWWKIRGPRSRPAARAGPWYVSWSSARRENPREIVLHWPERKIPLVADAVVGDPPGKCKLLPDRVVDEPARLRESARALLALDFDIFLVGYGAPILQSAKDRLRELTQAFSL